MKKTITLAALALGLAVSASAATLQYGLDFNTIGSNGIVFKNLGDGATTIGATGGYCNYVSDVPVLGGVNSHRSNGATFNISDNSGIDGLNFTDGFTLAVHLNYADEKNWKDALTLKIDDTTFRIEMNADNKWVVYGGGAIGLSDDTVLADNIAHNDWHHLGLTFQGDAMEVYLDGVLETSLNLSTTTNSVVQQIRGSGSGHSGYVYMDNFAVYDGVLTANDMKYLSTHNIPEPATATLSLLALAGLAARRRRK